VCQRGLDEFDVLSRTSDARRYLETSDGDGAQDLESDARYLDVFAAPLLLDGTTQ
jgi:hypothetical protein